MTVVVAKGLINLEGRCLVEDAEPLLLALQDDPRATVEISGASRLHLAVVQILLATNARISGVPQDQVARRLFVSFDADQSPR